MKKIFFVICFLIGTLQGSLAAPSQSEEEQLLRKKAENAKLHIDIFQQNLTDIQREKKVMISYIKMKNSTDFLNNDPNLIDMQTTLKGLNLPVCQTIFDDAYNQTNNYFDGLLEKYRLSNLENMDDTEKNTKQYLETFRRNLTENLNENVKFCLSPSGKVFPESCVINEISWILGQYESILINQKENIRLLKIKYSNELIEHASELVHDKIVPLVDLCYDTFYRTKLNDPVATNITREEALLRENAEITKKYIISLENYYNNIETDKTKKTVQDTTKSSSFLLQNNLAVIQAKKRIEDWNITECKSTLENVFNQTKEYLDNEITDYFYSKLRSFGAEFSYMNSLFEVSKKKLSEELNFHVNYCRNASRKGLPKKVCAINKIAWDMEDYNILLDGYAEQVKLFEIQCSHDLRAKTDAVVNSKLSPVVNPCIDSFFHAHMRIPSEQPSDQHSQKKRISNDTTH